MTKNNSLESWKENALKELKKQNIDSIIHEIIDKNQLNEMTLGKQPYSL